MFGIGHMPELVLILVLATIFVGPGKLPSVGAALGQSIAQFKKATSATDEDPASDRGVHPGTPLVSPGHHTTPRDASDLHDAPIQTSTPLVPHPVARRGN